MAVTQRPRVLVWDVLLSQTFQCLAWVDLHREAKVGQFDVHLVVQEDVLWLQVPMDNTLAVEELHHLHQSAHNLPDTDTHNIDNSSNTIYFPFGTFPDRELTGPDLVSFSLRVTFSVR